MIMISSEESLDAGPDGGPNFAEILNKALPDSDHSSCDSHSDRSSNSGEVRKSQRERERERVCVCVCEALHPFDA